MKRLLRILVFSTLGLILLMSGWWAYREAGLRYAQWKYSRELKPGTTRQVIEDRFLSAGVRFYPESPGVDFVSVGDEMRYSIACAPREVGMLLEFKTHDGAPSGADVLESEKTVRQERGCM